MAGSPRRISHWKSRPGLLAAVGLLIMESLRLRRTTIAFALLFNLLRILSFIASLPSWRASDQPWRFRAGQPGRNRPAWRRHGTPSGLVLRVSQPRTR
jgi:hypothetical protein